MPRSHPAFRNSMRGAMLLLAAVFVAAAIGGALVAFWVFKNIDLRLVLANQPAMITIDQPVEVRAEARDNLQITLNDTIHSKVPVDQMIRVPVKEALKVIADFDGQVPIKLDVKVRDSITIDEVLDVDAVVDAEILGDKLRIPIRGKVPVKAKVPVSLDIPVDQMVGLKFTAPVGIRIKQDLQVPLKTVIEADIPINASLSVPVNAPFGAKVEFSPEPFAATIVDADLRLPLRTLRLNLLEEGKAEAPAPAATPAP